MKPSLLCASADASVLTSRPRLLTRATALLLGLLATTATQAAVNDFVIGLVSSGTAPFDTRAGAGLDNSPTDAIVRTHDQFSYRVGYSLAPADTQRLVTLSMGTVTVPGTYSGPALAAQDLAYFSAQDLPTGPNGCSNITSSPVAWPPAANATQSGVSADGQHIVCVQTGGQSGSNMDFIARVAGTAPNGTTISPPIPTFRSANNTDNYTAHSSNVAPLLGTPTLTVSAAPRWEVVKQVSAGGAVFVPGSGPAGEDGYIAGFSLGVRAVGSRKGLEALQPNFTITENFNDPDMPNARLINWPINVASFANLPMGSGAEPAQQNGCGDWRSQLARLGNSFDNTYYLPMDNGATAQTLAYQVSRGGTCVVSNVNNATKIANLNVTGTDFSLSRYPTLRGTGSGTLVGADLDASTNEWWVANKSVLIWIPLGDLTPNTNELLTNTASLTGTSVTGQANLASQSSADATVLYQTAGGFNKLYTSPVNQWTPTPADSSFAVCDPKVSGDCWVNQAAPGQLIASRLGVTARANGFSNGYFCDKIDNSRLTLADMRSSGVSSSVVKDAGTGIAYRYQAGNATTAPMTFELGVGGNRISGGTWGTRSNVSTEYHTPQPATNAGDQALAMCGDSDATWYPSIAALRAAGHDLSEVSRVRGSFATFGAASSVLVYLPLRVNDTYAYRATETGGTTPTLTVGQSTLDSISPNQAVLVTGIGNPLRASDAMRITQTEYARITKTAKAPHDANNGQVARGATVDYQLQVNLTSTTNAHQTDVTVWDVLPAYVDIVPGSSQFGTDPITPVCWAKGETPPAPAPFAANSVGADFQACQWTLPNQPVALASAGAVAGNLPLLTFQARVSGLAPAPTNLLNTAYADSSRNMTRAATYQPANATAAAGFQCSGSGNTPCSVGNWNLITSTATGIVLEKAVSHAQVPPDTGFSYGLRYGAIGTTLNNVRILDVLPVSGEARGSAFRGVLQLAAAIAPPVAAAGPLSADADLVVRYTRNMPGDIQREPYHASHDLTGGGTNSATTTNWCLASQFGSGTCPANWTEVTAFMALPRANADGVLPQGLMYQLTVSVLPAGNVPADLYVNDFVADSPTLTARNPGSNQVRTTVNGVAGRVYVEASNPANSTDDGHATDPGIAGVSVRLVCTSPAYDQTTTTGPDGRYLFTGVAAGAQCTLTQTQPAGYTNAYNTPGTGGTGQTGGNGTGDSTIEFVVPPYGGSTGNNFAETLPGGADMRSAVVCTPSPAPSGATVSCTATCTNSGTGPAVGATCSIVNAAGLPGSPTPTCSPSGIVAVNASLTCTVQFTMPTDGSPVNVRAGTGAINDVNGGNDPGAGNNPSNLEVRNTASAGRVTAVPTLGWPMLAMLASLLGWLGMRRKSWR